ncbi:gamma-glutamylcyclotransferase [Trinickia caryophylli]|uniref:glutathione-specific gamma-glutamylcyclotransferase n=1 Tax=Trinickia caryophylli TaxID=28094 RepID=A0A1X7ETK8_TRICW|nr:gamma-glutamylcyclotransferase [Trinickia caryophylli]PMS12138.1 gamma-glutamylcyclotransferase [Trinickia caryophylli]TRX18554.1 gamma-glutamylcyclotransferase [Trinickia caryophylli]WQE10653.1 gamma-glutamylcyclotransferase [Trinickia caryophylli]SMF39752.1 cation transport protein ChaC [Trinickia caryophylli]GLU33020.1 gamma-glutamylcyclotransferase [Trinickia caryophylli]
MSAPRPIPSPAPCGDDTYPPSLGEARLLSDDELAASLARTLEHWDGMGDLWLFGYGSLIWNPGLPAAETMRARVRGYHRGLYLWSRVNRGTPEQPGLVLALDRGGSCTGMAFRLAGETAMPHLEALWRREMPMGSYRPAWLPCALADGRRVKALAFVMRRDVPTYTGKLSDAVVRTVLGCACGRYGTTRDYVSRTVAALRESGMPDRALESLLKRCAGE